MPNPVVNYRARVKYATRWTDPWQILGNVSVARCMRGAAPIEANADLHFEYGDIKREGATTFTVETVKDLRDKYIRIELVDNLDSPTVALPHWHGVIPRSTDVKKGGISTPTGTQMFQAVGLEHLLDRRMVAESFVKQDDGTVRVEWIPKFNQAYKKGYRLKGNRSKTEGDQGVFVFSMAHDREVWNNKQIADYLLKHFMPDGPEWVLDGQVSALEQIEEVHQSPKGGRSLWDWMNVLIDRRRGLGFKIVPEFGPPPTYNEQRIFIQIFTLTETDITVGPRTIPANPVQLPFSIPSTFPEWHLVDPIEFTKTTAHVYDRIEAWGERMLVCTTVSVQDTTLKRASKKSERDAYIAATEEGRLADRFDGTWTRFIFDPNWTYALPGEILGVNSSDSCILGCDDDGHVTTGLVSGGQAWHDATVLERTLPFKRNVDYTAFPPAELHEQTDRPEFVPIMVFAKLPTDVEQAGQWRLVEKLGEGDTALPNSNVRALDTQSGFEIQTTPRHLWAAEEDDWPKDEATGAYLNVESPPRLSHKDVAATVAFRTDRRIRVAKNITTALEHELKRRLIIECPGAEYWYATRGTVVDVNGQLRRINEQGRVLRDDVDILQGIVAFASAWFEKERQSVKIPLKTIYNYAEIGTLLTTIEGQYQEQVNTVISSIETDFRSGTITYTTGWGEYDLIGAMLDDRKGMASKRANEMEYVGDA